MAEASTPPHNQPPHAQSQVELVYDQIDRLMNHSPEHANALAWLRNEVPLSAEALRNATVPFAEAEDQVLNRDITQIEELPDLLQNRGRETVKRLAGETARHFGIRTHVRDSKTGDRLFDSLLAAGAAENITFTRLKQAMERIADRRAQTLAAELRENLRGRLREAGADPDEPRPTSDDKDAPTRAKVRTKAVEDEFFGTVTDKLTEAEQLIARRQAARVGGVATATGASLSTSLNDEKHKQAIDAALRDLARFITRTKDAPRETVKGQPWYRASEVRRKIQRELFDQAWAALEPDQLGPYMRRRITIRQVNVREAGPAQADDAANTDSFTDQEDTTGNQDWRPPHDRQTRDRPPRGQHSARDHARNWSRNHQYVPPPEPQVYDTSPEELEVEEAFQALRAEHGDKSALRKLAKRYHPDINKDDPKAEEKAKLVNVRLDNLVRQEGDRLRREEENA